MTQYIDKSALVAEIEKRRDAALARQHNLKAIGQETVLNEMIANELNRIISFLDHLEVKEVDTWHLQEKEDIYDAVKDWGLYSFACIMKDGTIQRFNGILDEDYEGHINVHINGVNDDYDNVDDIVKWIEFT